MIAMNMIEDMSGIPIDRSIPALSLVISISVTLAITIISSIFPILSALSQKLHDSVDI
jgi:ABC-type antimicrobial peptide transport system permease subunit